ncbi:uncharacterized protein LOC117175361 [Belonocnema kinseyi]|uniref:uncharacterized protein LOC117175361 n=1 Tax=Belonocnema kinseyi TaxID=2817044 RepID=UPI00143CD60E|nr:uncharacterized protein LOC117175361 [Belonocnema kinseyi]
MEEEVFSRFGYPRRELSDNGPQFTGQVWVEASRRWGAELWTTPVYHPRANPTDRRNQEMKKGLRLRLHQGNQRTWDQHLPDLLSGLRRRKNAATGVTPRHLLMGRTILRPGEWELQPEAREEVPAASYEDREREARQQQAAYQDKNASAPSPPRYFPGDWVYAPNHQLSSKVLGYNDKLAPARRGLYQILDHISGEVYWIWRGGSAKKVHGSVLVPAPAHARVVPPQERDTNKSEVGMPPPLTRPLAESVGGVAHVHPVETVDREEDDEDSSSHYTNDEERYDDEQENEVDPTGRRHGRLGTAGKACHTSSAEAKEQRDDIGRRYQLRQRAPVAYRDARAYAPRRRRAQHVNN